MIATFLAFDLNTFASHAIATGAIAMRELRQWMGHSSSTTTERYAHFMPAEAAADRLGAAFSTSLSIPPLTDQDALVPVETQED